MVKITLTLSDGTHKVIEVQKFPFLIGRGKGNDLILDNDSISQLHGQFIIRGGDIFLADSGSTNGVFVNGIPIKEHKLSGTGNVRLGDVNLLVELIQSEQERTRRIELPKGFRKPKGASVVKTLGILLVLFLLFVFIEFQKGPLEGKNFFYLLTGFLLLLVGLAVMSLFLGIISKLFHRSFVFLEYFNFLAKMGILYGAASHLEYLGFYFEGKYWGLIEIGVFVFLLFLMLYGVGRILLPHMKKIPLAAAVVFSLGAPFGIYKLGNYLLEEEGNKNIWVRSRISYPLFQYPVTDYTFSKLEEKIKETAGELEKIRIEFKESEDK